MLFTMSATNSDSILAQMMMSGEFSDLIFICRGQEFKVHKAIVCAHSPVIKAAVQGEFEVRLPKQQYCVEDAFWQTYTSNIGIAKQCN